MTSVDSGIETSNNSDDSSIAQNEDIVTEEINNDSASAMITNNQNEVEEIRPGILHTKFSSDWSLCLSNSNVQNSIPTSSSRPRFDVSPNNVSIVFFKNIIFICIYILIIDFNYFLLNICIKNIKFIKYKII